MSEKINLTTVNDARVRIHQSMIAAGELLTCTTCLNFVEGEVFSERVCSKFNAKPPLRTIVVGCDHHDWEGMPF